MGYEFYAWVYGGFSSTTVSSSVDIIILYSSFLCDFIFIFRYFKFKTNFNLNFYCSPLSFLFFSLPNFVQSKKEKLFFKF